MRHFKVEMGDKMTGRLRSQAVLVGLREDIELLLGNFLAKGSLKFADFAECWREMNFVFVFTFRLNQSELREFIEDAFLVALEYLNEMNSTEQSVSILFMIYSLFSCQPIEPKIPFKLTMDKFLLFRRLYDSCKRNGFNDACYVWLKLNSLGAFHFTLRDRALGPTYIKKIPANPDQNKVPITINNFDFNKSIEELKRVHTDYLQMKNLLAPENTAIQYLDLVNDSVFKEYDKLM